MAKRDEGRDIMALLRNTVGGDIHDYTKLLAESREEPLDRMTNGRREKVVAAAGIEPATQGFSVLCSTN